MGRTATLIFGSLELLQDYLKIAMESKKRAEPSHINQLW